MPVQKPAKIFRNDKRVNMNEVQEGDTVFAQPPGWQNSIHCTVTNIEIKNRKKYIYFSQVGGHPERFSGHHRQFGIKIMDLI